MPVPQAGVKQVGPTQHQYPEHLSFDAVTIAGSSRLTQDYQENILGHRSGITVDPTRAVSIGLQLVATAYAQQTKAQSMWQEQRVNGNPNSQ